MRVSFEGMKFQVDDLFWEIERKRSYNQKKYDLKSRMIGKESKSRELWRLASSINYEVLTSAKSKSSGIRRRRPERSKKQR